jgi:hypothetical protein
MVLLEFVHAEMAHVAERHRRAVRLNLLRANLLTFHRSSEYRVDQFREQPDLFTRMRAAIVERALPGQLS